MLVSLDYDYHKLIKNKLSKVTEMAKICFSRINEIEISYIKSERIGDIDMCDLKNCDIKFQINVGHTQRWDQVLTLNVTLIIIILSISLTTSQPFIFHKERLVIIIITMKTTKR